MKTETTKKSISVSNLTLSLWLGYVKQAAIDAGIVEEVKMNDPVWGEHIELHAEEAVADEVAHCMYCACIGQTYAGKTEQEIIKAEAEGMLYQLEVTAKYDLRHTAEAIKALRAALADLLADEQMTGETEAMEEAVCEDVQKELDAERREELFRSALSTIWDKQEYHHLRSLGIYDYHDAMLTDVIQYIMDEEPERECSDRDELEEKLNDELWTVDSVTGNGSGSYTFSREEAKRNVSCNVDLVREMAEEFCVEKRDLAQHFLDEDWEWFDVSIRCYLLSWAIQYALDLLQDGLWKEVA